MESAGTLKQLFKSSEARERGTGATVLGSLQTPNYYQPLLPLMEDPDPSVQRQAIYSAGQLRHPMLIPKLIEKLGRARQERYVRDALAAYGTMADAQLATALADRSNTQKQIAVVKVLRQSHTPGSAQILRKYFHDSNDHLRAAVAQALAALQMNGVHVGIPRAELLQAASEEIKRTYSIHVLRADLSDQVGPILGRALHDHLGYILDHLFSLLSLLYPQLDMRSIHRALRSGGGQKVTALELIDAMADKEIRDVMLPLIEAPEEKIVQIAATRFGLERSSVEERLNELSRSDDPVLRACALYQLGMLSCVSLPEAIDQNIDYNHSLVQETVLWAMRLTGQDARAHSFLERGAESQFASVRTYAKHLLKEAGG
jgi:HEAT repeat protein